MVVFGGYMGVEIVDVSVFEGVGLESMFYDLVFGLMIWGCSDFV